MKWIALLLLFLSVPAVAQWNPSLRTDPNVVMLLDGENDLGWFERDPGVKMSYTGTELTLTTLETRNSNSWVMQDYDADYFSADLDHRFKMNISSLEAFAFAIPWMLCDIPADTWYITDSTSTDGVEFQVYDGDPGDAFIKIIENGAVAGSDSFVNGIDADTDYFITVRRDDDAGANNTGQWTCYICTVNFFGEAGSVTEDTLTADCSAGEQNDYRYLSACNTVNTGLATKVTGVYSNYQIDDVAIDPNFSTYWPTNDAPSGVTEFRGLGVKPDPTDPQEGSYVLEFDPLVLDADYATNLTWPDANLPADFPINGGPTQISATGWFNTDADPNDHSVIMGKVGANSLSWDISIEDANMVLGLGPGDGGGGNEYYPVDHTIIAGTWYHFGMTFDAATDGYYVQLWDTDNTTLYTTSGTHGGSWGVTGADFIMGSHDNPIDGMKWYDGAMDELTLFNDILDPNEIDEIRQGIYGAADGEVIYPKQHSIGRGLNQGISGGF